jgi:iron complex outermembrane receptor protein
MNKKLCAVLLLLVPFVLLAQDSLPHVSIAPLEIISERSLKADDLHAIDSTLLLRSSSLDIATTLQRSGLGMVNSYGAPGSIASFRLGGMSSNYVTVELNGAVLNSPTLGMADLSLIPSFFIQSASLGERNFSGFQRNVGLAATLRLESSTATKNEVSVESTVNSLQNIFYGMSVSRKRDQWKWSIRAFQSRNENKFSYRDIQQWEAPLVTQTNNNNMTQGVQSNLVFEGKKRTHYFNTMAVNRYALLPSVMGGVGNSNANQHDDLFQSTFYCEGKRKTVFSFMHFQSKQGVSVILSNQEYSSNVASSQIQTGLVNAFANGSLHMRRALFQINPTASLTSLQYRDWSQQVQWKGGSVWASYIQDIAKGKFRLVSWVKPEWRSDRSPIVSGEVGIEIPEQIGRFKNEYSISASTKSRMPSANDLYWIQGGNENLISEKANWIQTKWSSTIQSLNKRSNILFQLNAKIGRVSNWIQWIPMPENFWMAMNFKTVNVNQAEGIFSWKTKMPNGEWNFSERAEYTYASGLNANNSAAYQMIYTPQLRANTSVSYSRNSWSAGVMHSLVGKRYTDEGNTSFYALPSFNVLNASVNKEWQFNKNKLSLQFEVQNITNTQYQWLRGYALPGRVYSIGIKFFIH